MNKKRVNLWFFSLLFLTIDVLAKALFHLKLLALGRDDNFKSLPSVSKCRRRTCKSSDVG